LADVLFEKVLCLTASLIAILFRKNVKRKKTAEIPNKEKRNFLRPRGNVAKV
jgi:hypothetical protein